MGRIRHNHMDSVSCTETNVWKVGKYIRLSRDDGNHESESIINQRKILDEQISTFFHNDYTIVDEYIDDGRTGTSDNTRPDFLRLITDVKSGKINCIITKNLSRAFRNSANQGKFLEEFIPLYNTRFISLYEPHIDTFLNPEIVHSLEVSITGFMNEQYAYKTSVDVRRTLDTKRKNGEFIGAFAPYGYKKKPDNKNSLLIDEEAAQVVRAIFYMFVDEGMSKNAITLRLNELGIPNPASYKRRNGLKYCNPHIHDNDGLWNVKTVCGILTNQMYIGDMVQGRQKVVSYKVHNRIQTDHADWYIVENTHEAIIEKEKFVKAAELHLRDTRTAPAKKHVHLFSGFIRCADCDKAMTRKNTKDLVYYACSTYTRKSKTQCSKHTIREDILEKIVLITLQKQISLVESLAKLIEEISHQPMTPTQFRRIEQLLHVKQTELANLLSAADSLYLDWKTGEITPDEYHRIKSKIASQAAQLKEVIQNLETEKQSIASEANPNKPYLTTFIAHRNIEHLERKTLVDLVDNVYVHKNGEVTIVFKFSDQHRSMLEWMENSRREQLLLETKEVI